MSACKSRNLSFSAVNSCKKIVCVYISRHRYLYMSKHHDYTCLFAKSRYGELQGLNKKETADKFGKDKVHEWRRSYDIPPPNGESLEMCAERAVAYFKEKVLLMVFIIVYLLAGYGYCRYCCFQY